ncbi:hypothetical protein GCM10011316_39950 [Roseibium aquae]|uniref:Prohead serine protease domain-containing protein n=2 Tax=Roseibium aquae TaxID=1323746 RepID=A0A916TP50_9HYPH|nr:hypothetical protein GCM10011316_39950 [Roseibium aquae]
MSRSSSAVVILASPKTAEGASRLIRQRNFAIPESCREALIDWVLGEDPVLAWIDACVKVVPIVNGGPMLATRDAHLRFQNWAQAEGFAPATADPEGRTVEVVWSTGAPVRRRDMAGQYIERLSLAPEAVDLSRLEGASVLDAHRQTAVRDVLGSVRSAAVDGKRGTALIQFSARPEVEPVWQDVLAGILRHVSVGYSVEDWAETTENGVRVLTAVRWTPHEISLVPTPADPGAHIRMETEMTDTTTTPAPTEAPTTETRAEANAEIRSIARIAGLDQSWIDGQIDGGADPDTARRAAFEALAKRSAPAIRTEQVRVEMGESQDDPALRARQMGEALYARINPRHELSGPARRYAYSTPVDMAKELLTLRGESTMALSPASLVTRALHTTSDFPIILGDTVGRVLRDAYQAAPSGIRRLGRQTTARDFRAVNKIMLGDAQRDPDR